MIQLIKAAGSTPTAFCFFSYFRSQDRKYARVRLRRMGIEPDPPTNKLKYILRNKKSRWNLQRLFTF
jgi:hypothetical protein